MPAKAKFSEPCNRCGVCCALELCPAAELVFVGSTAPCPALDFGEDGKSGCGLVAAERLIGESILSKALGIGCGCSCPDNETTEAEIDEHDRKSYALMYGPSEIRGVDI